METQQRGVQTVQTADYDAVIVRCRPMTYEVAGNVGM